MGEARSRRLARGCTVEGTDRFGVAAREGGLRQLAQGHGAREANKVRAIMGEARMELQGQGGLGGDGVGAVMKEHQRHRVIEKVPAGLGQDA
ncbi:hypothetical protein COCNU_13G007790 [Cocos nucifera]|uniref:Uncharacterized protein n=1 Tax=Cocos nucifera TaxID=13894 RepID=A0A8K0NBH7_COCNU|nr:hypothetical protein COCNU_13G007790 [Cocos nucifera]